MNIAAQEERLFWLEINKRSNANNQEAGEMTNCDTCNKYQYQYNQCLTCYKDVCNECINWENSENNIRRSNKNCEDIFEYIVCNECNEN